MKTNFLKSMAVLATFALYLVPAFGQSPEKMSYQAVIRNSSNTLVTNTQVGMQISILQGSASGTAVYVETQTPTTNANGLVSLEIGGGSVVSGNFTTIDWANGPYFIKTETDPAGGTSYSITGTSQLLSVPYALHAKTAESITGTITESQISDLQNYLTSEVDGSVTNEIQTLSVSGNDLTISGTGGNTVTLPVADGSETKVIAGTNVTVTGSGKTGNPYVVSATGATTLTIGQSYQGGIIFWLDATGQHGLIAATVDQSTGIQWYNGSYTTTNAVRDGIGAGIYNTERIIANQGVGSYAAQLCANYQGGGYGDWYLPSKYELNLLYLQKTAVGGFASAYYWSSTECNSNGFAWSQSFDDGYQDYSNKYLTFRVRAVRAF